MNTISKDLQDTLKDFLDFRKQTTLDKFLVDYEFETDDDTMFERLFVLEDLDEKASYLAKTFDIKVEEDTESNPQSGMDLSSRSEELDKVMVKDSKQAREIFDLLVHSEISFTADTIFTQYNNWGGANNLNWTDVPLTSIRRALNTLKENGYISATGMVDGLRGAKTTQYRLSKSVWEGVTPATIQSEFKRVLKKKANLEANLIYNKIGNLDKVLIDLQNCLFQCSKTETWIELETKVDVYNNRLTEWLVKNGK